MKSLTIRHPWPWAICFLGKDVENRSWCPSPNQLCVGEDFAIHAGKMPSVIEIAEAFTGMDAMGCIDEHSKVPRLADLRAQESKIVAVAVYAGAVKSHPSKWFVGMYGWTWSKVVVLPEPVPCRGAQGLWTLPPDVEARVVAQLPGKTGGAA
jgi:hypothetical protein